MGSLYSSRVVSMSNREEWAWISALSSTLKGCVASPNNSSINNLVSVILSLSIHLIGRSRTVDGMQSHMSASACICLLWIPVCVSAIDQLFVFLAAVLALSKYTLAEWNATDESANRTVSHCRLHGNRDNCTGKHAVTRGCFEVALVLFYYWKSIDVDVNMQTHLSLETLCRRGKHGKGQK